VRWAIKTTADLGRIVVVNKTTESLHLDFKKDLDRGPDAQPELGRDIAQFANNEGGCLLLGVSERKDPATRTKTAIGLDGVGDADRCCEDIETWIRNVLVPADFSRTIDFISTPSATFVAVNVPASRRLIWVADPGQNRRLEVVRRTNHGKEYMRPAEIERHWSNTARSAQIAFQDVVAEATASDFTSNGLRVEIVGGVARVSKMAQRNGLLQMFSGPPRLGHIDDRGFELRVPIKDIVTVRIPFELLSTAWLDGGVVHLMCLAPLIYDADAKALMFDPFGFRVGS
jgi:hypothetical protein